MHEVDTPSWASKGGVKKKDNQDLDFG